MFKTDEFHGRQAGSNPIENSEVFMDKQACLLLITRRAVKIHQKLNLTCESYWLYKQTGSMAMDAFINKV